jgi:hypothetical protein
VFQTFTFLQWTYGKVVLLQLDYKLPVNLNDQLLTKYNVTAFPCIIGLNANGTELGRVVGYSAGNGPAWWISSFEAATGL